MTNTELLRKKIEDNGLKQGYIAEKLGITSYGFAKKLKNETEFKASEIKTLCELLNITSLREKESIFFDNQVD